MILIKLKYDNNTCRKNPQNLPDKFMIFLPTFGIGETCCFAVGIEYVNLPRSFQIKGSKDFQSNVFIERY